jgi:hypothetical protein
MMRSLAVVLLLFAVIGCVRIKKDSVRYATLPSKPIALVELLPASPEKPFKVIGRVFVGGTPAANWQQLAEAAREEAAAMGADAIVLGDAGELPVGTIIMPGSTTTNTTGDFYGNSFSARSRSSASPTMAMAIQQKRMTGTAILYDRSKD